MVVALPSLFNLMRLSLSARRLARVGLALGLLVAMQIPVASAQVVTLAQQQPRYINRVELHTAGELMAALKRADQLYLSGEHQIGRDTPVAFVLHGAEARVFMTLNYAGNQDLVNLAAKLSALKVVDIKVCQTWMGGAEIDEMQLLPFVGTVPYGPAEERRLVEEEGYVYF